MKFFQRLGRSLMLPVAVLPVAAILSGLGYWILTATGDENNLAGVFLKLAGGALLDNLPLLFAIGVSVGMATKPDGTSALAGLVSWLMVTTMLSPANVALFQGIEESQVNPAFSNLENVFVGMLCGLVGAWSYDHFKEVKLPDALSFFSGRRSVAIVTAGISLGLALVLFFVWPLVYSGLVGFGEFILTLGPVGVGIYGFLNRLLIPLGLHHALNSVFWFDVAGINDLGNFLDAQGTYGVTGQYMTGFFPIMMMGLPGAALAMYVTARTARRKVAAGVLLSSAIASFFVGVTEPLEFSFMFLAPGLYVVHALFTGISMAVSAMLPVRMGFGFSGGFIDLVLGWVNPMAQNPWAIPLMGAFWFVVYFFVFRAIILRFDLKTPGRESEEDLAEDGQADTAAGGDKYAVTATSFLAALGGAGNIVDLENCATRLRMELVDVSVVDEAALKRAGAAGTMKPGGRSFQVIYGTSVQFVKDAMERIMTGQAEPVTASSEDAAPAGEPGAAGAVTAVRASTLVRLRQPLQGTVVPLSEVPDATFAEGVMGPGVAIEPTSGEVVAPAAGTVTHVFPTGHAVALTLEDDTEVLIHVGLDTVKMRGEGFTTLVTTGERVSAGTPLLRADLSAIRVAGHPLVTPVIVMNDKDARIELV
ncbi:N-acetylglucosamine-specific PTS transporter subunit IIBC [Brachybacterium saurashtrense]|uniref:PTS sucrose transporter subunit IIBC n=1 Tax=Brachybacterium saurashtrense TaxID=556288 RepID=A0A345YRS8_9MICO|nr:N-acetylglucosamine-specific PTS transporter subunit IIBC [Brachybacterium saurashtrense]AXK46630.1 PTS sucrose transporter subunit IIBC [Brachybacterium saurashtrense]RRR20775.1 PTS sucrose transporter subunit IIBC [Brachybacterium saurashtrense]